MSARRTIGESTATTYRGKFALRAAVRPPSYSRTPDRIQKEVETMSVNYTEAKRIVDATFASATEMGIKIAIAVLDERGDTVIQARMDGAKWWWVDTCRAKAFAIRSLGNPQRRADPSRHRGCSPGDAGDARRALGLCTGGPTHSPGRRDHRLGGGRWRHVPARRGCGPGGYRDSVEERPRPAPGNGGTPFQPRSQHSRPRRRRRGEVTATNAPRGRSVHEQP